VCLKVHRISSDVDEAKPKAFESQSTNDSKLGSVDNSEGEKGYNINNCCKKL
jgi:hypothetical protein